MSSEIKIQRTEFSRTWGLYLENCSRISFSSLCCGKEFLKYVQAFQEQEKKLCVF